jgi:hypothetical protein
MSELIPKSYNVEQARIAINNAFSGQATFNSVTAVNISSNFTNLVDDATIIWDMANGSNAFVTITNNRTLQISGAINGCRGTLFVQQGGIGGKTLTLGGFSATHVVKDGGAGAVSLSTALGAIDKLSFFCKVGFGQTFYWKVEKNFT